MWDERGKQEGVCGEGVGYKRDICMYILFVLQHIPIKTVDASMAAPNDRSCLETTILILFTNEHITLYNIIW